MFGRATIRLGTVPIHKSLVVAVCVCCAVDYVKPER